ncbi:transposase [Saccharopolyspora sp. NPDC050389]|uniref:transposase n=1 Tax=Saccharopolyspora sp. NPDC050389 TaxID=3155516 RepID=UPI0033D886AC
MKLSKARIAAALRRAGRSRNIDQTAAEIKEQLRKQQLHQPSLVEEAFGCQVLALLATLNAACIGADELGEAAAEAFRQHPDYGIITSFPGLADSTGARLLAEIGDDRSRFADARALKAYAGSAPVTRASGRSISITYRRIKNDRLAAVGWLWAFIAATHCEPAKAHYRRRRDHGDRHSTALRHLFNRMLGQLYHCLQTGQTYDETKAFPSPSTTPAESTAA